MLLSRAIRPRNLYCCQVLDSMPPPSDSTATHDRPQTYPDLPGHLDPSPCPFLPGKQANQGGNPTSRSINGIVLRSYPRARGPCVLGSLSGAGSTPSRLVSPLAPPAVEARSLVSHAAADVGAATMCKGRLLRGRMQKVRGCPYVSPSKGRRGCFGRGWGT